ncbi:helix-turn-helix transcriptional regulator [Bacillus sp. FJAT-49732]|uniref:Helix-turn-helix transcriptional regulator n=1 Tax=Lederbergia citrisecunda TaxID=2833583 RepID=A0A942YLW4_9BACI|nr:PadR family transcriptional regulator [Lederbergia citrisecunda]MBS4201903.1 helix-turn-helix transcriptional regulator [Lederbergia citrisecunda]
MNNATPISSDLIRGHIDTIILRVLSEGDNYGYEIIKSIFDQSKGKFELKEPSLYTSLKRLEKQKYISAYWGDESQGGRRKYYKITDTGRMAYKEAVDLWLGAKELIDLLIVKRGENDE